MAKRNRKPIEWTPELVLVHKLAMSRSQAKTVAAQLSADERDELMAVVNQPQGHQRAQRVLDAHADRTRPPEPDEPQPPAPESIVDPDDDTDLA